MEASELVATGRQVTQNEEARDSLLHCDSDDEESSAEEAELSADTPTPGEVAFLNSSLEVPSNSAFYRSLVANCIVVEVFNHTRNTSLSLPAIRIKDRYVLVNHHLFFSKEPVRIRALVHMPGPTPGAMWVECDNQVAKFPKRDIAIFQLPQRVPACRDILHLFNKPYDIKGERALRPLESMPVTTMVPTYVKGTLDIVLVPVPGVVIGYRKLQISEMPEGVLDCGIKWQATTSAATKKGHCGSAAIVNSNAGPIIVGIHSADYHESHYFSYLDQKDLNILMASFTDEIAHLSAPVRALHRFTYQLKPPIQTFPDGRQESLINGGNPMIVGGIAVLGNTKYSPRSGDDLRRTNIPPQPEMPFEYEPANLHQENPLTKIYSGINAVNHEPRPAAYYQAAEYLATRDSALNPQHAKAFRVPFEILNGITLVNSFPMDNSAVGRPPRSSSASFPWNTVKGVTQMQHLLQETMIGTTSYNELKPEFQEPMYTQIETLLKQWSKKILGSVAGGFLKSEKRPLKGDPDRDCRFCDGTKGHSKVDLPRVVGCPEKAHSMALQFLFGSWAEARILNRHEISNKIGMDVGTEWNDLGNRLASFPNHTCIDYSFFDKTEGVTHSMATGLNGWMYMFGPGPEYEERFREHWQRTATPLRLRFAEAAFPGFASWLAGRTPFTLLRNWALDTFLSGSASIVTMYNMFDGKIFFAGRGEVSGVSITGDFNGCNNETALYAAIHEITKLPYRAIDKLVYIATYGDDTVLAWDSEVKIGFYSLAHQLIQYGLLITPANKGSVITDTEPFESLTFLKRSWAPNPFGPGFLAPLEKRVIDNMWYWRRKALPPRVAVMILASEMVDEYAQHPPEVFENQTKVIQRVLQEQSISVAVPSQQEVLSGKKALFNGVTAPTHLLQHE